jgi:hypothetical protein
MEYLCDIEKRQRVGEEDDERYGDADNRCVRGVLGQVVDDDLRGGGMRGSGCMVAALSARCGGHTCSIPVSRKNPIAPMPRRANRVPTIITVALNIFMKSSGPRLRIYAAPGVRA